MSSSWHSWGFWSHTAGTYFWFCHGNNISPAVPVRQGFPASTECMGQRGRASVEGKGKMSQGSSCASYLPLGWNSVFSSVIPLQVPWASWVLRQGRAGVHPHVQLLRSALRWWSPGPCRQGAEFRKWGGTFNGGISFALQGGLEQKCFCAPFLQSIPWQEEVNRVMGLCIHSSVPPHVFPCAIHSSAGCSKQITSWLKLSLKTHHHLLSLPLEKLHLWKFCGGLMLVLP